jgi:murein DD-endopeptidase MepM/ murein hydrolase activator NlpD
MAADEKRMRQTLAATAAAKRHLQSRINRLVARQYHQGNIPSQYNGTLRWPMGGVVTQDFGCTGVVYEPPMRNCAHWHNGIDIVAPYGTAVHASGAGRVVYVGWNTPTAMPSVDRDHRPPQGLAPVRATVALQGQCRQRVSQGQVIGYEGNTGTRPAPPPLDGGVSGTS